jgi:hypothetical protein
MLGPVAGGLFVDLIGFDLATFLFVILFLITVNIKFLIIMKHKNLNNIN